MDFDSVCVEVEERYITQDYDIADIPVVEDESEYDGHIDFDY